MKRFSLELFSLLTFVFLLNVFYFQPSYAQQFAPSRLDLWECPGDPVNIFAEDMMMLDLNGDGQMDFIRAVGDSLIIMRGLPGLQFATPLFVQNSLIYGTARDIAAGDLSGDGHTDFLVALDGYPDFTVYYGDGSGGISAIDTLHLGLTPQFIELAEMNGDQQPDLLVIRNDDELFCYTGQGSGQFSFSDSVSFSGFFVYMDLKVGDFNEDGNPDLILGGLQPSQPDSLIIVFGDGSGGFGQMKRVEVGWQGLTAFDLADFNEDGHLDIVTTCPGSQPNTSRATLILGDGAGGFAAPVVFEGGSNERYVKALDVNGDGHSDLLIASTVGDTPPADFIGYLTGDGSGNFTQTAELICVNRVNTLAAADLDGDGVSEIIAATPLGISLYGNDATGFPEEAATIYTGEEQVQVKSADLNNDGLPDVVDVCSKANVCKIILSQGGGNFAAPANLITGNRPVDAAIADVNGDAIPDLLVVNRNDNTLSVFPGNGDGTFAAAQDYPVGNTPIRVETADLNGDGYPDFLVLNEIDKTVSIGINSGNGQFTVGGSLNLNNRPFDMSVGDLNGDSYPDLVVSLNEYGQNLRVYPGDGNGGFSAPTDLNGLWLVQETVPVQVADVNGDTHMDIIFTEMDNLTALLGSGDGSNFTLVTSRLPAQNFGINPFQIADLNGDALPDVVLIYYKVAGTDVMVAFGDGAGAFVPDRFGYQSGATPNALTVNQFNNDAHPDLMVANAGSNFLTLLLNSGAGLAAHDVGVSAILSPPDSLVPGSAVIPRAVVKNYGTSPETFAVSFSIGSTYQEAQNVSLSTGQSDTVSFPSWQANAPGTFQAVVQTTLSGDENASNDQLTKSITVTDTSSAATLTVSGITPNRGGYGGEVSVTITGNGFQDGAQVVLSRSGEPDFGVAPFFTTVESGTEIRALFLLHDVNQGTWDVTVQNPDNSYGTLYGGFTVELRNDDLWITIVGRNDLLLGEETPFTIWYGNSGNVDARDILIVLKFTGGAYFRLDLAHAPDSLQMMTDYELFVYHAVLSPGEMDHFDLLLTYPPAAGTGPFEIEAILSLYDPQDAYYWDGYYWTSSGDRIPEVGWTLPKRHSSQLFGCGALATVSTFLKNFISGELGGDDNAAGNALAETAEDYGSGYLQGAIQDPYVDYLTENTPIDAAGFASAYGSLDCGKTYIDNWGAIGRMTGNRIASQDPNDKAGPAGIGAQGWVTPDITFPYVIYFENVDTATAPAHKIVVRDTLDPDLDWSTLQFLEYKHQPTSVTLDTTTGEVVWTFDGIDLPPNVNPPEGESHFSFYLEPKKNLSTGTQITNRAGIFFDYNEPVLTSTVLNTIDAVAPVSSLQALPAETGQLGIQLNWSGQDDAAGSGIDHYVLYVSRNGGAFRRAGNYTGSGTVFIGRDGSRYDFYIEALDAAGNKEIKSGQSEAGTVVRAPAKIAVSPSPFVPARGHTVMTFFGGDVANSVITIFNRAGDKIITLRETEGNNRLEWDGKNDAGNPCASGVYIWVLDSPTGGKERGKFAIIR